MMKAEAELARRQIMNSLLEDIEGSIELLNSMKEEIKRCKGLSRSMNIGREEGHLMLRVRSISKRIGQVHIIQSLLAGTRKGQL